MHNFVLVDCARFFAIGAHGAQKRKYTHLPYYTHLENVVELLWQNTVINFDMLVAAWLHDVVEDTTVTIFGVQQLFGVEVAKMVSDLTEPHAEGKNRAWRKAYYNEILINSSKDVQTIKYADMLDNTSCVEQYDPDFAKVYLAEKRKLLPLLDKGCPVLYNKVLQQCRLI